MSEADDLGTSRLLNRDRSPTEQTSLGPPLTPAVASIELENVTVDYPTRGSFYRAIQDVSIAVEAGSFVVFIGPSGCGKTTILNAIAGFVRPTSGKVLVGGQPVSGPGADRAVVHQHTAALLPWLNVEQNVELPLKVKRIAKVERRRIVADYLELVGLTKFATRAIYHLSGGMQQRVALARALAAEPPIILLDEPLGALDALQRELMQDFLLDVWHKTKRTFLLITHSVEEAVYLATQVIVITAAPGRVLWQGPMNFGRQALAGGGASVKEEQAFVRSEAHLLRLLKGQVQAT